MNPYETSQEPIQAELSRSRWDRYDWAACLIYVATAVFIANGLRYW